MVISAAIELQHINEQIKRVFGWLAGGLDGWMDECMAGCLAGSIWRNNYNKKYKEIPQKKNNFNKYKMY